MRDDRERGAVILAGGDSKRLGRPKALLQLGDKTLVRVIIDRLFPMFQQITVVTDRPELFTGLPVRLAGDLLNGGPKTPLRGIHAGLSVSTLPYQFVIACDMPFLNPGLIHYMANFAHNFDAVVPRIGEYYQPLHAFYARSCLEPIRKLLLDEEFKITPLYAGLRVKYIDLEEIKRFDPGGRSFFNINTHSDYKRALRLLTEGKESG